MQEPSTEHLHLSDTQKLAVDWNQGSFLLLAGPGSGKTSVLTRRVIRLLEASPNQSFKILALTFTNRAADEMRSRIEDVVPADNRLLIGTFHAFAADVLRQAGQSLGLRADFKIYSRDEDRADVLEEAIASLKSVPKDVLRDLSLLSTFDRAGSLLLTSEQLKTRTLNKDLSEYIAAAYDAYHQHMLRTNVQDFTSLVLNAFRLFDKYPALTKKYRQVYRYWNIDEFQDTTLAQFQLLKTVAGPEFRNVFAVADDDQIIFQWNGASYQRIQEFIKTFEPTVLQLPANYRCPESIVALANKLIANNRLRQPGKQPLIAARAPSNAVRDGEIALLTFADEQEEAIGIADHIAANPQYVNEPTVVLARVRSSLELLKAALREKQLPGRIVQRRAEFQTIEFRWLHAVLRAAVRRTDEKAVRAAIGQFNALVGASVAIEDVKALADARAGDYLKAWIELAEASAASHYSAAYMSLVKKRLLDSLDYEGFVDEMLDLLDERFTVQEAQQGAAVYAEDKEAWQRLVRDIKHSSGTHPSLDAFLQELEMRSKEPPLKSGEIALMTIHTAKGSEFEHVILVGLAEDIMPAYQSIKKGEASPEMEEERRNCFVAITRTRQTLTLSRAKSYRGWRKQPSRFLREMGFTT